MTLSEIRDWLKDIGIADNHYIGRLDNKKERSIGVYGRSRKGQPPVALGGMGLTSYGVRAVSLLLHWNTNARETEAAARALWDALLCAAHVDLPGGGHIQCVRMNVPEPVAVGTDRGGVYEYVIEMDVYYRR
jgi:hypothetical protein